MVQRIENKRKWQWSVWMCSFNLLKMIFSEEQFQLENYLDNLGELMIWLRPWNNEC